VDCDFYVGPVFAKKGKAIDVVDMAVCENGCDGIEVVCFSSDIL